MKECNYIQQDFLLLTYIIISIRSIWLRPSHCRRKWWLVTEYWINFEMAFTTVEPLLDSFNTYASVEPLYSSLYLSCPLLFDKNTEKE